MGYRKRRIEGRRRKQIETRTKNAPRKAKERVRRAVRLAARAAAAKEVQEQDQAPKPRKVRKKAEP